MPLVCAKAYLIVVGQDLYIVLLVPLNVRSYKSSECQVRTEPTRRQIERTVSNQDALLQWRTLVHGVVCHRRRRSLVAHGCNYAKNADIKRGKGLAGRRDWPISARRPRVSRASSSAH